MFGELCKVAIDESFWKLFMHPYLPGETLKYYVVRFINRVQSLAVEKNLKADSVEDFSKSMVLRKYRTSCARYYDTSSYTEEDVANDGKHLLSIMDSYEWIAVYLGIDKSTLENIRLREDARSVRKLFGEVNNQDL